MKKFFIFFTFIIMFISTPSFAIDPGFYIGIGGSYAQQDFDINSDVSSWLNNHGVNDDFSNTGGINLKVGYRINDMGSLELVLDHLPGFDWDYERSYSCSRYYANEKLSADVDITTLMLAGKVTPDFGSDIIRPFITAGIGLMYKELDVELKQTVTGRYNSYSNKAGLSESDISPCFKLGAGIDFFIKDNISLGIEAAYVVGAGSLELLEQEIIDECKYMNYTFGAAYYF